MEQVASDVYRLGSRSHNFYVIRDGDAATLIDAGCSGEWASLVAGLESIGVPLAAVAGLVATHSHSDHFGLAEQAQRQGIGVSVHEAEETRALGTYSGQYAAKPADLPWYSIRAIRTLWPLIRAGILNLSHLETVGTFTDGDRLDLPGHPVAVHTPGHTEGHVMFHLAELGLLFTGDGLVTMDLLGSGPGPQLLDDRFHNDPAQAAASLDRITALEASLLLPGHGEPWSGSPAEAVAALRG